MACKVNRKKSMMIMLVIGLALMAIGAIMGVLLQDGAQWQMKAAGVANGAGCALAVSAGVILLRRHRMGAKRAADSELELSDERGIAVAYRAQNTASVAAVLGIVAIMMTALFRGDMLYMSMGVALCFVVAAVKLIAWVYYNKRM